MGSADFVPPAGRRPAWEDYFLEIARVVAGRATCLRRSVGAVLVREHRILATGYNGAPEGLPHCNEVGCLREAWGIPSGERQEICRGLHAEQNALLQAARYGTSIQGATIYVTHEPCVTCSKMLINAGVNRVVFLDDYPDELGRQMRAEAGLLSEQWKGGAKDADEGDRSTSVK